MESDIQFVTYGNVVFKINERIGHWGDSFQYRVHSASVSSFSPILPYPYGDAVTIKIAGDGYASYKLEEQLNDGAAVAQKQNILLHSHTFKAIVDQKKFLCVVMPSEIEVISIRQKMSMSHTLDSGINSGIPEDCVAIALCGALKGLMSIHLAGKVRRLLSCGTIVYDRRARNIKLVFGAALFERKYLLDVGNLPGERVTDWGRAPELDEGVGYSPAADVWLVGIAALEMCYGSLQVESREELLHIAEFISSSRTMPSSWEEVRQKAAEKSTAITFARRIPNMMRSCLSILSTVLFSYGYRTSVDAPKFSAELVEFVGSCLDANPTKRPISIRLQHHRFIQKSMSTMKFFENKLELVYLAGVSLIAHTSEGFNMSRLRP